MFESKQFSAVEVQASEWLLRMTDGTVSLEDRTRFESWLRADPEHERVYQAQKTGWQLAARMSHLRDEPIPESADRSRRKVWPWAMAASVLVVIGAGIIAYGQHWFSSRVLQTPTAQIKEFRLQDGTRVTLGAASKMDVDIGEGSRRVRLTQGEAFFDVAKDAHRPFYVTAGSTVVRVLGTKFDVHYGESVRVAVLEGKVEVTKSDAHSREPASQILTAGQGMVAAPTGAIAPIVSVKQEDLASWRHGRRVYLEAPLRDVVNDMNRYYPGRIELADEALGEQRLTFTFRADQIDRALEVLAGAVSVEAVRQEDGRVMLVRK